MSERTITQVTNELQQVRDKVSKLELEIQAQKDKALELTDELAGMLNETLGVFGKVMDLRDKDGLPQVTPPRRTRTPRVPQQSNGEPSTAVLKDWAASADWEFNGEKPSKYAKRIPDDMRAELLKAYKAAHPLEP